MSKEPMNRAQRRRLEREAKEHRPTFWDSTFNRVWTIALAAAVVGVIGYAAFFKSQPASTATKTPPPPPAQPVTPQPQPQPAPAPAPAPVKPATDEKVTTKDLKVGTGDAIKLGDRIAVHYTGTLTDGTKFDSSRDRGQPYELTLGTGVIEGWNQGIVGMKKGGRRTLVIPPSLGYGASGKGKIPPNATLNFDIEVVEIKKS